MKTTKFLSLLILILGFASCDSDDSSPGNDTINFEGSFSRNFDVQGITQRATYKIEQGILNYDLSGGFAQTNYDTKKVYYSQNDNRWIGFRESNSTYHVIFFKNISETEITLYKKEVGSLDAGKSEPIPAADDTENHGWNTYQKDLPINAKIENLHAPQEGGQGQPTSGPFTKFDFSSGQVTSSDSDWDIAFRGTTIIINGGTSSGSVDEPERDGDAGIYIATGTFESITSVDNSLFIQDSASGLAIPTGSGNGWYDYTGSPNHLILPIPGKILVIKTRDGRFAKVEILSYYKDAPDTPNAFVDEDKNFTFNFSYQPSEDVNSL